MRRVDFLSYFQCVTLTGHLLTNKRELDWTRTRSAARLSYSDQRWALCPREEGKRAEEGARAEDSKEGMRARGQEGGECKRGHEGTRAGGRRMQKRAGGREGTRANLLPVRGFENIEK